MIIDANEAMRERESHIAEIFEGNQPTSAETAVVVKDYPYGYSLRCQKRYWIETKPGYGQRLVTQTTNPRRAGPELVWNTPKAETYSPVVVLWREAGTGYIKTSALSDNDRLERVWQFKATFWDKLNPQQQTTLSGIEQKQKRRALDEAKRGQVN